jgi:hypothetical protein
MKKITITFIGTTLLSAASYATPQATVDISLLKSEAMSIVKKFGATLKPQLKRCKGLILIFNVYFQFSGCQSDCFLMRSNKRFCLSLER